MAVHVLDSLGRRQGLPGKKSQIYTVQKYGSSRVAIHPSSMVVYRSTTQSIAASAWVTVAFDTAPFPYSTYGQSAMWSSGNVVSIIESGWYLLSAAIRFQEINVYNTYQGFRIYTATGGYSLLSGRMYVPNQYYFPQSGEIVYYLNRNDSVRLDVSHSHTAAMTLYGGIGDAMLSVARVCS
jgi:hypothetical protein